VVVLVGLRQHILELALVAVDMLLLGEEHMLGRFLGMVEGHRSYMVVH
jgi:hypothetical protein